MKMWSATSSVIVFLFHRFLRFVASLGKFGEIGIARWFFLEVSAPLGRSIVSFPQLERDFERGREGKRDRGSER